MKRFLICVALILAANAFTHASEEKYQFEDAAKRELFLELTQELRCPMCQNQNIADSDAMIANDLRRKVYQLLKQGKSREEVVVYMKSRYGDFVSYKPPVTPATLWLWLLPVLFVLGAVVFIVQSRKKAAVKADPEALAKAEVLLEKD